MTDKAVIQGAFSDFRIVKGRKVAQIIIEVPIEAADHALAVLGGVPRMDTECWVAIARLNLRPRSEPDHRLSQQAGICCRDPNFQDFLQTKMPESLIMKNMESERHQSTAHWLRKYLQVATRADLDTDPEAAGRWSQLYEEFCAKRAEMRL